MSYLQNLLNTANDLQDIVADAVDKIKKVKFTEDRSTDGTVRMITRGEVMLVNWVDRKDDPEFRLRIKLYYSTVANAIVDRMLETIRSLYGDIQTGWIDNYETIVDEFVKNIEILTMGELSHLLPEEDEEEKNDVITDFDKKHFVDLCHLIKVVDGIVEWGEFRTIIGRWDKDKKTNLLHRTILNH